MRRTVPSLLLRLGLLAAALSLATMLSVTVATPLHSETGGYLQGLRYSEPIAVERPVAGTKSVQNPERPNIRPEPAVAPEIRALEQKEIRQQEAARRKLAQQELRQKKAEQRKLEQQKAAQLKAEQQRIKQQKLEQREAEQQEAEQREAARQKAEQRETERRRAEKQRAEQRKAQAKREKVRASSAARRALPQPAGKVGGARVENERPVRGGSGARAEPPAPRGGKMALSINSIGLRNSPIETSEEERVLDRGLMHLPQTSRPWERGNPRNVYVVGHRVGWPNTGSWKIFYRINELKQNDELVLTAGDKTYRYKVTEKFVVTPWDMWVTDPVKGRDLLTLQTCTGPDFSQRLIIRADRV